MDHFCLCSSGLNILYQGEAELNKLLKLVLTEGDYCKLSVIATDHFLMSTSNVVHILCNIQGKEIVDCLNFGMLSLLTWQTNCKRIDFVVRKMTTTGKMLYYLTTFR